MSDLDLMLRDYRLTTAEIVYRLPDHPAILQSFVWQQVDLPPKYPVLMRFLDFWEHSIDGKLHSVKVASTELIAPAKLTMCKGLLTIH